MKQNRCSSALVAAAFAALLMPAGRVLADCTTSLADPSADCKAAAKCQKAISGAAKLYVSSVQQAMVNLMTKSRSGGLKTAPKRRCIGGPNNAKPCLGNNGVCKLGSKGKLCSTDGDCGGTAGSCNRATGAGCNPSGPDDVFECQVDLAKDPYAGAIAKAQTKLSSSIKAACVSPTLVPAFSIGITNISGCPRAAAAPDDASAYSALIQCIEQSLGGDFGSGNVVDANQLALQISAGNGVPPNNKLNHAPRMLLQLTGTQLLQIGTAPPSTNGETPGGNLEILNLAHCVGGNGNGSCINDSDCGTDAVGSTGTCTANTPSGGEVPMTGSPVYPSGLGPVLNLAAQCAAGVPTCLVTHTSDSGNGTTTSGSINLSSGHYSVHSPIITDVVVPTVGVDCSTFQPCPVCDAKAKKCTGTHADILAPCDAADGAITIECKPTDVATIHVPNPFNLSTDEKALTPVSGNNFCGYCDSSAALHCQTPAMCSTGCQTLADCAGTGASVCDFGDTSSGFLGNSGTSIITAPGVSSQYQPLVSGVFCTGITINPTVNGAAGLPGPVRIVQPYTLGYVVGSN